MASHNLLPLLLLLLLPFLLHVHARDIQSFSKIPTTNPNNDQQSQQQEPPTFLPQDQNPYGLFPKNSDQLPAATTSDQTEDVNQMQELSEEQSYNADPNNDSNNNNFYGMGGMSDTRFVENGKYFYDVNEGRPYERMRSYYDGIGKEEQFKDAERNVNWP